MSMFRIRQPTPFDPVSGLLNQQPQPDQPQPLHQGPGMGLLTPSQPQQPGMSMMDRFSGSMDDPMVLAGLGLIQMGQERLVSQPAPTGLLEAAAMMSMKQGTAKQKAAAEKEKARLKKERDKKARMYLDQYSKGVIDKQQLAINMAQLGKEQSAMAKNVMEAGEGADPTTAQRNYEAAKAGGYPGTFFDYQRDLKRSGASKVEVNTTSPARALNPDEMANLGMSADQSRGLYVDGKGNIKKVPVPEPPMEIRDAKKRMGVLDTLGKSISAYKQLLAKHGTEWGGRKSSDLKAAHTGALLRLKEFFDLGAIQGADMDLMLGQLGDPTTLPAQVHGGDRYLSQVEQLEERLAEERAMVEALLSGKPPPLSNDAVNDDDIDALVKKYTRPR